MQYLPSLSDAFAPSQCYIIACEAKFNVYFLLSEDDFNMMELKTGVIQNSCGHFKGEKKG